MPSCLIHSSSEGFKGRSRANKLKMSTKYKKLSATALVKNAYWELRHALPATARTKRVTIQVRVEKERLRRIKRQSEASGMTISKTLDWLIDVVLPPEKDGTNGSKML